MAEGLVKSTVKVSSMTFLSRILGFIRDIVCAAVFGAFAGYDAFLVAFRIPNLFRSLFGEGAFSQAFVPLLSEHQSQQDPLTTKRFIDNVAGCLALLSLIAAITGIIFAPVFIAVFAPGFAGSAGRYDMAVDMLRITFPYLFFIILTAFSGSILNTFGNYTVPAFTPTLLNIVMIAAALFLAPCFAKPIYALACGLTLGGMAQMLFQWPFLARRQLLPRFKVDFTDQKVRRLLKLMLPALFGVSISQLSILVSTLFASFLPIGSVSWLYYADRLMQFPLGVFGVALATVVLPHLSRGYALKSEIAYQETLRWAMLTGLLIALPAATALFLLATPLVSTLFQHGRFSANDVQQTALALRAYGLAVFAYILIKIFAAAFYARQDIKTPVKIAVVALAFHVVFSGLLAHFFQHMGLALASSCSALLNAAGLLVMLLHRGYFKLDFSVYSYVGRLVIAAGCMTLFLILCTESDAFWVSAPTLIRIEHLSLLVIGGASVYFVVLRLLGLRWHAVRYGVPN